MCEGATTLTPAETKDVKVHVTLRLDPELYKAVLAEKKRGADRTTTATIERLLRERLEGSSDDRAPVLAAMRSLIVHGIYQEAVLGILTRAVTPASRQDKATLEELKAALAEAEASDKIARLKGVSLLVGDPGARRSVKTPSSGKRARTKV
jgi:hypothetical protein